MEFLFTLKFLKIAAISAVLFILLDMLWIGFLASKMYSEQLGYLAELRSGKVIFNLPVGLLVQAVISLGLSVIILLALQLDDRLVISLAIGAFTGFVIYFTYDFTNYSFVKGWSLYVSVIDVAWGTLQGLLAGAYVYFLNDKL
ncbi:MAG: DUF2177 family protein [Chitinophagales bacterium]|nr:DUF2177 family protein [Chitinophagales bacterium]